MDYCNSVLFGLPVNLIQRLQSVQNAAARLIFRIRRSEHVHYPSADQPPLAARSRTCQTGSYDVSIHPRHLSESLSYLPTVMFHPRFRHAHPDDGCGLLPHFVWTFRPFVSLQSAGRRFRFLVPPSGTTCLSTSHLRRHSRFSTTQDLSVFPFLLRHYII